MEYFNNDIKIDYLARDGGVEALIELEKNVFINSQSMEAEIGKDISEWTGNERLEFFKRLNTPSIVRLRNINSRINSYHRYVREKKGAKLSPLGDLDFPLETYESCIRKIESINRYVTRSKLLEVIEESFVNACDKFIFLGLFEGIKGKNFEDICWLDYKRDFDFRNIKLKSGKIVRPSLELVNYMKQSADTYEYYAVSGKGERVFELIGEESHVIKDMYNASNPITSQQGGRAIYRKIIRQLKAIGYEKAWTANTIYESGMLHWVHTAAEKEKVPPEKILHSENYMRDFSKTYNIVHDKPLFMLRYNSVYGS